MITVIIDDSHPLEKEMRIINERYVNWLKRHGKHCEDLVLGFTAPANSEEAILTQCRRLLMQDVGDDKTLAAMNVDVVVVDASTGESKQFKLKWDPNARLGDELLKDPVALGLRNPSLPGKEVLLFEENDEELASAIAEARRRIPELKKMLDSPQAGVIVRVPWIDGEIRNVYEAALVGRKGDELKVEFTPDYAPGPMRITFHFDDLLDWTVHHENGTSTGGFTEQTLEKKGG